MKDIVYFCSPKQHTMERIGERVKYKREQLKLQLNELAKKVGISPSALSQIEKAKSFPSIVTLKLIAENLHTTVGELIGENESLQNNPIFRNDEYIFIQKNDSGSEVFLLSQQDMSKQMGKGKVDTNKMKKMHERMILMNKSMEKLETSKK